MSYSCDFSFKKMEPAEIMPFLVSFKHACTEHLKEIAEETFWMCPFNVEHYRDLPAQFKDISIEERSKAQAWAHNSVFKFKYFYNPEMRMLGVSGVYQPLQYLFDGTVHFQDSTDQDYQRELYGGIKEFEDIYSKWMMISFYEFEKEYEKRRHESFNAFIEQECPECIGNELALHKVVSYYLRTYCYEEIWSHFSQYLWNDEDQIYFSVYGNIERHEIMNFVKYCHEAQLHENKKEV